MKTTIIKAFFFFLTALIPMISAAQQWSWAHGFGGISFDSGNSIAFDSSGNVIAVGNFEDTVDFDPSANTLQFAASSKDLFIIKLDSSGNMLWAKSLGDSLPDDATNVVTDVNGDIYIAGQISGIVDLDPDSTQVLNLGTTNTMQSFIIKLNPDGNLIWAHCSTGSGNSEPTGLRTDNSGNLILSGRLTGQVDIDSDSTTLNTINVPGFADYVARLDTSGNFDWVHSFSGGIWATGPFIAIDNMDNIWITGSFSDTMDFDPGDTTYYYMSPQSLDVYYVKLSPQGDFLFANKISGNLDEKAYAVNCDGSNNVYIIGNFRGNVDFDPDSISNYTLNTTAPYTVFMVKLNSSGVFQWAKKIGGTTTSDHVFCNGADVDQSGNLYVTGHFEYTIDFDPDPLAQSNATCFNYSFDIFVSIYDSNGNFIFKDILGSYNDDKGNEIKADGNGKLALTGAANSGLYIGPFQIPYGGSYHPLVYPTDIFIAQMGNIPVGLSQSATNNLLKIYPNPARDEITINIESPTNSYHVFINDITGKTLIETTSMGTKKTIDISELETGVYIIRIEVNNQEKFTKLIILK